MHQLRPRVYGILCRGPLQGSLFSLVRDLNLPYIIIITKDDLFLPPLFCCRVEDVQTVIGELTAGPVIIVSLSMGGWLSLVAAQATPFIRDRLSGMVLYAPAINYVYPYYQFHRSQLSEELRNKLDEGSLEYAGVCISQYASSFCFFICQVTFITTLIRTETPF